MATVLIDARNVLRSRWPNVSPHELEESARAWATKHGHEIVLVWEKPGETADDWIARHARDHRPYWLVTSDRGLRALVGPRAERVIGGGAFVELLRAG